MEVDLPYPHSHPHMHWTSDCVSAGNGGSSIFGSASHLEDYEKTSNDRQSLCYCYTSGIKQEGCGRHHPSSQEAQRMIGFQKVFP